MAADAEQDAEFQAEYPFTSRFFSLGDLRLHYVDEGQGEPLLFVHGNPSWSFAWRHLIRNLQTDHRCLAVDHIGCGFSDKPQRYDYRLATHIDNLVRFIDDRQLRNVTLVAHDWGGAIGIGAALQRLDRFKRFVLMNTAAFRSQRIPLRIAACRIPLFGTLAIRGANAFAGGAIHMAVEKRDRMTPAVKRGYLRPYDSWAHRIATLRFVQDIPLAPSHPSYGTLQQIEEQLPRLQDFPVLLVWGMRDWCFSPHFLAEFQQRLPQAETFEISDAGHYVFEDAHERIVPRVRTFLDEYR